MLAQALSWRHSTNLLKEHNADTDVSSLPAALLEAICPRSQLQKSRLPYSTALQVRVLFDVHLLVESNLGLDIDEFLADSVVGWWQLAQLGQSLKSLLIPSLRGQPSRGEWKHNHSCAENKTRNHLQEKGKSP